MSDGPKVEPDWVQYAVFWQVFPLGFVGAEPERLDADRRSPPSAAGYHRVAGPRGRARRERPAARPGLRVGVARLRHDRLLRRRPPARLDRGPRQGCSRRRTTAVCGCCWTGSSITSAGGFARFAAMVEHGPGSADEEWFRVSWRPGAGPGDVPAYDDFEGHGQLVALNHDSPSVLDFVVEVMCHWLAAGADGWRLDAAYAVPLPFWAAVSRRVRERFPGGVPGRGGDPRRLPVVRHRGRLGLDHPVRAVEGDPQLDRGQQLLRAGACAGATCRVPRDLRPAHLRRQSRRDPDRQRGAGRAPAARGRAALLRRRHADDLLRRRAGLAGGQGGTVRWRRRDPSGVPARTTPGSTPTSVRRSTCTAS